MDFLFGFFCVVIVAEGIAIAWLLGDIIVKQQKLHWVAGWNAAVAQMERADAAKPRTLFSSWI